MNIERISNVCVILTSVLFAGVLVKNHLNEGPSPTQEFPTTTALAGRKVNLLPSELAKSPHNVVLVLSTHCQYCDKSAPFYKQLIAAKHTMPSTFQIIAAFDKATPTSDAARYLQQNELVCDAVVSDSLPSIGRVATPTLLITDNRGNIRKAWRGLLTDAGQKEVLDVLRMSSQTSLN